MATALFMADMVNKTDSSYSRLIMLPAAEVLGFIHWSAFKSTDRRRLLYFNLDFWQAFIILQESVYWQFLFVSMYIGIHAVWLAIGKFYIKIEVESRLHCIKVVAYINTMKTTFNFNFDFQFFNCKSNSMDTYKHGNKEKLSINRFL